MRGKIEETEPLSLPKRIRKNLPEILVAIFLVILVVFLWGEWNDKVERRIASCKGHAQQCQDEDREARSRLRRGFRSSVPYVHYED
jgi:hypothetical protein